MSSLTCRWCARPWCGAPCGNCGCGEPAEVRPPAPAPAEAKPKAGNGNGKKAPAKKAGTPRVSTTVKRVSATVDGPGGGIDVKAV